MFQGWRNGLWIVLVCSSLACSKPTPANNADGEPADAVYGRRAESANKSGGLKTPPAPDGDNDSGTAQVSDTPRKTKSSPSLDDDNPFKESAKKSPIEQGTARKSLAGNWILVLTRPGQEGFIDFHTSIITVAPAKDGDGALTASLTAKSEVLPPFKLSSSEITKKDIRLTFDVSGTTLDFQGSLKDGLVLGNALFGNCLPARLMPTKEVSLDGFDTAPEPVDARALGQAFGQESSPAKLKALAKFVTDRPNSPLSMMAWEMRVFVSAQQALPPEKIEALADDYQAAIVPWGERLQQISKANVAVILAHTKYNPDFALKYLTTADKGLTDESLKDLKAQLKTARESILTVQAMKYLESDDAERAEKAVVFLTKLRGKNPFDPVVLYGLARYHQKSKQTDEAIALFAELASLPMLEGFLKRDWDQSADSADRELPSATLAKLWEAKHGQTDGLDEYKDEIYRKRVLSFADKPAAEAPAGNRLVLCELFTGSSCPPCVGADIATGALELTYPKTQVIVLRYHQHIPGPDPLTNADGEDRFANYYRGQGTPTVLLNGAPVNNVGGYLPNAPEIYRGLRTLIDQQLEQTATLKVDVKARISDDKLQLIASVQGLEQLKDEAKDVRLRVVIAEDEIHFLARNGVRSHEMIVRAMVGGPAGVEPKDGKLFIKEEIPLAKLKASLADYLKKFEEDQGIDMPAKPLDLKRLHVVAFVQNDESHEVLQTGSIAVTATDSAAAVEITPTAGKTAPKKGK
ncbi:MAG: hypothetical protein ACKV2Q_24985 [Planctomycetaceae bacterium]